MDLWYPPDDQPPLLEWWTPLLLAASAARRERVPWPIHLDDFSLAGRVDRSGRPALWVYKHHGSGRDLALDATGQAYAYTPTPRAKSPGRFTACDIRTAVYRADLPAHVEPVWYEEPAPLHAAPWPGGADVQVPAEGARVEPAPTHPTRRRLGPSAARRHLTLIQGGRQAG